jgi:mannosyltransferase OCH1-like enzyme
MQEMQEMREVQTPRSIPRITHQIWFQGWDTLPDRFRANVDALHTHNPDYKHMQWDAQSLKAECFKISPLVAAKFEAYPHMIQKIDLGRCVVLHNYGGVTVDTDMVQLGSIDATPQIDTVDFIVSGAAFPLSLFGQTNNALLMATPHHPVVRELIQRMLLCEKKEADFLTKEFFVAWTTGPWMVQAVLNEHRESVLFLNHKYFEPCISSDPVCSPGKDAIMDHRHDLSWQSPFLQILGKILMVLLYLLLWIVPLAAVYGVYRVAQSPSFLKGIGGFRLL